MYDKKLEIALTAKDITDKAFSTLKGRIDGITKKVFSLQGAFAATAAAAGMGYFIKSSLNAADAIGKTADRIGVTTDALQEYRHAAELSGVQQSTLDKGLEAFTKRLGEAQAGTGALTTYLRSYNETLLENIQSAGSTDQALQVIFRAMENMTSASDRAALSAAAFGRTAGVQMGNMLREGTDGLNAMLQEARDLGLIIDESLIRESEKANDAITRVSAVIKTQMTATIVELAPRITDVGQQMTNWVKANRQLIDQNIKKTIDGIGDSLDAIVKIYNLLPPGVIGSAGAGVVGRILFGSTPAGVLAGSLTYIATHTNDLKKSLSEISKFEKKGLIPFPMIDTYQRLKDITDQSLSWLNSLKGVSSELDKINDSWMGRPLSSAVVPEIPAPDISALTGGSAQDMWKNFGGAETENMANIVQSAYGFNQPQEWLEPQLLLIESMTSDHFQRMKALTEGSKEEIAAVLEANAFRELVIEQTLASQKRQIQSSYLNFASAMGDAAISMTTKQGKTQFALQKSLQVALAIMDAWLAHNNALATVPYPANMAAAAHALKMGLLGAGAIAAASIGQMAAGGTSGGGGTITTPSYPAFRPDYYGDQKKGSLTINIQGDFIGDEGYVEMLAEKISDAVEERDVILVASNAHTADKVI